jgi:quinol monooxygenase YgiN
MEVKMQADNGTKDRSAEIRVTSKMSVKTEDLPELQDIYRTFIADVRERDKGVIDLSYFVDEENGIVHCYEHYESFDAFISHLGNMNQEAVGRLMELVAIDHFDFDGNPTPEVKQTLAPFGSVFYHRPLAGL